MQARLAYGGVAAMPVRARENRSGADRKTLERFETCEEVLPILETRIHSDFRCARQRESTGSELITNLLRKFFADEERSAPTPTRKSRG